MIRVFDNARRNSPRNVVEIGCRADVNETVCKHAGRFTKRSGARSLPAVLPRSERAASRERDLTLDRGADRGGGRCIVLPPGRDLRDRFARTTLKIIGSLLLLASLTKGCQAQGPQLKGLNLEQLGNIEVTTSSKE